MSIAAERGMMEEKVENELTITVGVELFSFENFTEWVDKAQGWYRRYGATAHTTVAIDNAGRVCSIGKQFMRARDEGAFPVTVYNIEL